MEALVYTYMWLREDGTPYYVGKGTGERAFRKGSPPRERILLELHESEADAFTAEKFLIAYYGRKDNGTGILRNLTDGGEGVSGSEAHIGHFVSEDTKEKLSASAKQRDVSYLNTPALIAKRARTYCGSKLSEATRARQRAAQRLRRQTPMSEATKASMRAAWVLRKKRGAQ